MITGANVLLLNKSVFSRNELPVATKHEGTANHWYIAYQSQKSAHISAEIWGASL